MHREIPCKSHDLTRNVWVLALSRRWLAPPEPPNSPNIYCVRFPSPDNGCGMGPRPTRASYPPRQHRHSGEGGGDGELEDGPCQRPSEGVPNRPRGREGARSGRLRFRNMRRGSRRRWFNRQVRGGTFYLRRGSLHSVGQIFCMQPHSESHMSHTWVTACLECILYRVCATNVFEKQDGKWVMVLHQGGVTAIPKRRTFTRGPWGGRFFV